MSALLNQSIPSPKLGQLRTWGRRGDEYNGHNENCRQPTPNRNPHRNSFPDKPKGEPLAAPLLGDRIPVWHIWDFLGRLG
jgi:hypothetical protein